jgi:hypothetical protein
MYYEYISIISSETLALGGWGGGTISCDETLCILVEIYDIPEELSAPIFYTQNGCRIFLRNTGKFVETERRHTLEYGFLTSNPSFNHFRAFYLITC